MNPVYLHLISGHVPVLGTCFGLCLLLVGMFRRSEELKRVALMVLVASALVALPAYLSGSPASGSLHRLVPGMATEPEEQHAEIAILALVGSLLLGVVSLAGLVFFRKGRSAPRGFLVLVVVLALLGSGLMAWTANLGARIRHPEIRPQSSATRASVLMPACFQSISAATP